MKIRYLLLAGVLSSCTAVEAPPELGCDDAEQCDNALEELHWNELEGDIKVCSTDYTPSNEPNETFGASTSVGMFNDSLEYLTVAALDYWGDNDWYSFQLRDDPFSFLETAVEVQFIREALDDGAAAEICLYWFDSENRTPEPDCADGTRKQIDDRIGCCTTTLPGVGYAYINIDPGTTALDDDGSLFLSIERVDDHGTCAPYRARVIF